MRTVKVTLSTGEVLEKDADPREVIDILNSVKEPTMLEWSMTMTGIYNTRTVWISTAHIVKVEEEWD